MHLFRSSMGRMRADQRTDNGALSCADFESNSANAEANGDSFIKPYYQSNSKPVRNAHRHADFKPNTAHALADEISVKVS